MDIDVTQDAQSDLDSDDVDVRYPDKKRFKQHDINGKEYMQEVDFYIFLCLCN